jgi:tellurite resistance protein TehA-like permease
MKTITKVSTRFENYLLLMPMFFAALFLLFDQNTTFHYRVSNTIYELDIPSVSLTTLAIFILPFIAHYFLRKDGIRNQDNANLHIMVSLSIYCLINMLLIMLPEYDSRWGRNIFATPNSDTYYKIVNFTNMLWIAQFVVQFIFLVYSIKLFAKSSNRINNNSNDYITI